MTGGQMRGKSLTLRRLFLVSPLSHEQAQCEAKISLDELRSLKLHCCVAHSPVRVSSWRHVLRCRRLQEHEVALAERVRARAARARGQRAVHRQPGHSARVSPAARRRRRWKGWTPAAGAALGQGAPCG